MASYKKSKKQPKKTAKTSAMGRKAGKSKSPKKTGSRKKPGKKRTLSNRLLRWAFGLLLLGLLSLFALFGAVYIGLFGALPTAEQLEGIHNDNAAELYASDGKLLGKYFIQNRSSIGYEEIPPLVVNTLVATEDSRYFKHEGIDFYSIPRVVLRTVVLGDRGGGGGSTLSQQLVKNVFGRQNHGFLSVPVNKLKENITALKLEDLYTKEEIIALYLNTVSFGENVYGIKAASLRFFNKSPDSLSPTEVATLIGMLKANTAYNPRLHPEASKVRRNTVLTLMARQGVVPKDDLDALRAQPLHIDYHNLAGRHGAAPYLRAFLRDKIENILAGTDRGDGKPYNLYTDGLRIDLTINSEMQEAAESTVHSRMAALQKSFDKHWEGRKPWGQDDGFLWNAARLSNRYKRMKSAGASEDEIRKRFTAPTELLVYDGSGRYRTAKMSPLDSVAYHQMILQAGFFALEAATGRVLAYVGGIDFSMFPYDHVHARRQVGSTFKPFVYTAALEAGYRPCDYVENERIVFSNFDDWSPENADGQYGGLYSLKGGMAKSVNVVAARLIAETGPGPVRDVAHRLGVTSKIPDVPSIALGVADLSLDELTTAYSAFVNGGKAVSPRYIERITNADGEVIYTAPKPTNQPALAPDIAETMREMLRAVADSGTARGLSSRYHVRTPMGGKTGTTQDNADGWFIGITPRTVVGAWVGAQSPRVRFRSTSLGQGAATAMPVVAQWVKSCEAQSGTAPLLGRRFSATDLDIALSLVCPMHVDSRAESFFEGLFGKDFRRKRKDIKENAETEKKEGDEEGSRDKGWIKNLFDKLKKK